MAEAVAWLHKRVEDGETETVKSWACGSIGWEFSNGMVARIDPRTHELLGFTFVMRDVAERPEENFIWYSEWGVSTASARYGEEVFWTTAPGFGEPLNDRLAADYHRLLNEYIEAEWFDPSEAWCPEGAEDLPAGYREGALDALGDVSFWADKDGCCLYVAKDEKEFKKISRQHKHLRQLSRVEAVCFVKDNYSDCYDWPDEV